MAYLQCSIGYQILNAQQIYRLSNGNVKCEFSNGTIKYIWAIKMFLLVRHIMEEHMAKFWEILSVCHLEIVNY